MPALDMEQGHPLIDENHPHLTALRAEFKKHKVAWAVVGCVAGACIAGATVGAAGSSGAGWANNESEKKQVRVMTPEGEIKSWWIGGSADDDEEEESSYCWSCDNAPSRGFWGWMGGYGECKCNEGWHGACCDEPTNIEDLTYGPYQGSPGTYELYTFDTKDTESKMLYPDCDGNNIDNKNVPKEFGGLWWMDGNPASDYVASFGRSDWKTVATDGYTCENTKITNAQNDEEFDCLGGMEINVYDDNVWSWHDESLGRLVYQGALGAQLTYKFECGGLDAEGKLTYCQVYPSANVPVTEGGWITIPPNLVSFDMTRGNDDLWVRNSIVAGLDSFPHNYYLKQITKCDGSEGKHWNDYVSHGTAAADKETTDVFGFGADERDKVSDVHGRQLLARKLA